MLVKDLRKLEIGFLLLNQANTLVLFQWAIEQREAVFEQSFGFALACEDEYSKLAACKIVASIMNKAPLGL